MSSDHWGKLSVNHLKAYNEQHRGPLKDVTEKVTKGWLIAELEEILDGDQSEGASSEMSSNNSD